MTMRGEAMSCFGTCPMDPAGPSLRAGRAKCRSCSGAHSSHPSKQNGLTGGTQMHPSLYLLCSLLLDYRKGLGCCRPGRKLHLAEGEGK